MLRKSAHKNRLKVFVRKRPLHLNADHRRAAMYHAADISACLVVDH